MIAIGCDHGALELKQQLIEHLKKRGVECKDYGTYTKDSCDYPVYAKKVAEAILSGECEEGILLCGTGIGMSMAANKTASQHRLLRNITMPMYCVWVQELSDQSLLLEQRIHFQIPSFLMMRDI